MGSLGRGQRLLSHQGGRDRGCVGAGAPGAEGLLAGPGQHPHERGLLPARPTGHAVRKNPVWTFERTIVFCICGGGRNRQARAPGPAYPGVPPEVGGLLLLRPWRPCYSARASSRSTAVWCQPTSARAPCTIRYLHPNDAGVLTPCSPVRTPLTAPRPPRRSFPPPRVGGLSSGL